MDATLTTPTTQTRRVALAPLIGAALGVVAFIVYFVTLSPTINFIDSGELTTAVYTLGVTHPTGYPLYSLLGWLSTHLPLGDDPAWRLNLLSAIFAAVTVGLFYALIYSALRMLPAAALSTPRNVPSQPRKKPRKGEPSHQPTTAKSDPAPQFAIQNSQFKIANVAVAATTAGLLAASLTFWSWATQAKMYTLHWAFVAALFLLALLVNRASPLQRDTAKGFFASMPLDVRLLHIFALVLGLSLTNHATTVLLLPGLFVLIFAGRDWTERLTLYLRRLPTLLPTLLAPLLLYLYLPLRANAHPLMDWGIPTDWPNFVRHVTGWQYSAYMFHPAPNQFSTALGMWRDQFGPILGLIVLLLAIAGLARLVLRDRQLLAATLLTATTTLFYALNYGIREIDSYYVPFYMMALLWTGIGLASGLEQLTTQLKTQNSKLKTSLAAATLLLPILAVIINWQSSDHHDDRLASLYVQNAYKGFATNALVMSDSWDLVSGSFYEQHIRGLRPDLTIVDISLMRYPWYMDYLERNYPQLIAPVAAVEQQYRAQQELFVNDKLNLSDTASTRPIQDAYDGVISGIVSDTLKAGRPLYGLFPTVISGGQPDNEQQIILGQNYHPEGLALRVDTAPGKHDVAAPAWDLSGITSNPVPQDIVAHSVTNIYPAALAAIGNYKLQNGQPDGQQLIDQASKLVDLLRPH